MKVRLEKEGILFCSLSSGIRINMYTRVFIGSVINYSDNYFASLNSTLFTDGSLCFCSRNTFSPVLLTTFFRIENRFAGQFERTILICEANSSYTYLEGCSASSNSFNQLHAAVVEILGACECSVDYFTVQNWFGGNSEGFGGVFNFVTKRALAAGYGCRLSFSQIEAGSSMSWKYPSIVASSPLCAAYFYSSALTKLSQKADTGTKIYHLSSVTYSLIISKGISSGISCNNYRGIVKLFAGSVHSRNFTQCDSVMIGSA